MCFLVKGCVFALCFGLSFGNAPFTFQMPPVFDNDQNQIPDLLKRIENLEADVKLLNDSKKCSSQDYVSIDGWILAYRLVSGIGGQPFTDYKDDTLFNIPKSTTPGCLTLDTTQPCDTHFKSCIIPNWSTTNPTKAKVVILKDSEIKQELVFNATGTDKMNWFSLYKVMTSTWTDITPSKPKRSFAIDGEKKARTWYINTNAFVHNSCQVDKSAMMVIDHTYEVGRNCDFDNSLHLPDILYSPGKRSTTPSEWEKADSLAVLVKLT